MIKEGNAIIQQYQFENGTKLMKKSREFSAKNKFAAEEELVPVINHNYPGLAMEQIDVGRSRKCHNSVVVQKCYWKLNALCH